MPELPDIEVYLEAMARRFRGSPLRQLRLLNPFVLRTVKPPVEAFIGRSVSALRRIGKRIVFEDTARAYDEAADDEREFPRKVRTLAGNFQLVALMPELLLPWRTRAWLPLVSHKLARLACPWALVGLLLLSAVLSFAAGAPGWALGFWRTLLLAQLAFYVLAALGGRAGRLGGLARTFVVLNAAAVAGLWRFVRGRQAVTW